MQNMLTARNKGYQTSCSPVVLSSAIKTHTVCLTLVNIFCRVWEDTLPRCLCEGEIGKQDRFTGGQDTGKGGLWSSHAVATLSNVPLCDEENSLIDRCGSQTEEPSGGGRRSCAIKGGQGVWLPVRRARPLWPLPSTRLSIISSTAALQVNTARQLFNSSHNYSL